MSEAKPELKMPADEETLEIPSSLLKSNTGFSFDIGGSCIKLVYALGEKGKNGDTVVVRMTSFSSTELKDAMKFLKGRLGNVIRSGQSIFTAGVGCHMDQDYIESELNVKLVNISEMDSFVESFRFLTSNYPIEDITYPKSAVATEYNDRLMYQIQMMFMKQMSMNKDQGTVNGDIEIGDVVPSTSTEGDVKTDKSSAEKSGGPDAGSSAKGDKDASASKTVKEEAGRALRASDTFKYPCILSMAGSGGAIIKVEEDKFMVLDAMTRCGRTFLGLGSLLTGCKTFQELIDLAAKGDFENLTTIAKQLKSKEDKHDVYSQMPDDLILYCFGRAVGRDLGDFKKEDLAAGLLSTIAQDIAQAAHLNCHVLKTESVFFCGSFVGQSQLVRDMIGRFLLVRASLDSMYFQVPLKEHHFLRFGGYLGALGCLIRNMKIDSASESTSF